MPFTLFLHAYRFAKNDPAAAHVALILKKLNIPLLTLSDDIILTTSNADQIHLKCGSSPPQVHVISAFDIDYTLV